MAFPGRKSFDSSQQYARNDLILPQAKKMRSNSVDVKSQRIDPDLLFIAGHSDMSSKNSLQTANEIDEKLRTITNPDEKANILKNHMISVLQSVKDGLNTRHRLWHGTLSMRGKMTAIDIALSQLKNTRLQPNLSEIFENITTTLNFKRSLTAYISPCSPRFTEPKSHRNFVEAFGEHAIEILKIKISSSNLAIEDEVPLQEQKSKFRKINSLSNSISFGSQNYSDSNKPTAANSLQSTQTKNVSTAKSHFSKQYNKKSNLEKIEEAKTEESPPLRKESYNTANKKDFVITHLKTQFPENFDLSKIPQMEDDEADLGFSMIQKLTKYEADVEPKEIIATFKTDFQKLYRPDESIDQKAIEYNQEFHLEQNEKDMLGELNYGSFDISTQFCKIGYHQDQTSGMTKYRMLHPIITYLKSTYKSIEEERNRHIKEASSARHPKPQNQIAEEANEHITFTKENLSLFFDYQIQDFNYYLDNKNDIDLILDKISQAHNQSLHIKTNSSDRNAFF